jgi:hypothetical protein
MFGDNRLQTIGLNLGYNKILIIFIQFISEEIKKYYWLTKNTVKKQGIIPCLYGILLKRGKDRDYYFLSRRVGLVWIVR